MMRFIHRHHYERPKISLLIPFGGKDAHRRRVLDWVMEYWRNELPDAEIIIGRSFARPFNKTEAFNDAARRARGRVLVLLDADAYMLGSTLDRAADQIIEALEDGDRLWFVPYRRLWRLNEEITMAILSSDPADPLRVPNPPPPEDLDFDASRAANYGRRYAAMAMVLPREALDEIGGFDERFNGGWGGEDVSLLRALDTLWAKHKSINSPIYHLWHPRAGRTYLDRTWEGQQKGNANSKLASSYHKASRSPVAMRKVVDAGREASKRTMAKRVAFTIAIIRERFTR